MLLFLDSEKYVIRVRISDKYYLPDLDKDLKAGLTLKKVGKYSAKEKIKYSNRTFFIIIDCKEELCKRLSYKLAWLQNIKF